MYKRVKRNTEEKIYPERIRFSYFISLTMPFVKGIIQHLAFYWKNLLWDTILMMKISTRKRYIHFHFV